MDSDIFLVKYDRRGTPLGVVSPGGFNSEVQYDAAGRIAAIGQAVALPVPQTPLVVTATHGVNPSAAIEVIRDAYARPVAWNAGGQTLLAASWGEAGTVGESSMLTLASDSAAALRLIDDFGRVVGIRNPGMGWQTARYDAGNRMVQIIDPRGARQTAQYDVVGRLLRLERHRPASRSPEETIVLRWQGKQQIEASVQDAAGVRRIIWRHDAQGRVVEEIQEITLAGQKPVRFILRRDRDKANERITLGDAGGTHSTLIKKADSEGRIDQLQLAGALPVWLGGGRTLVREIGWTRVAGFDFAERIVYGDGRRDAWSVEQTPVTPRVVAAKDLPHPQAFRPGESHDAAGLPALLDTDAGRLRLAWNAAGRLAQIQLADTSEAFIYDALGRRIAKRIGAHIRYFAYDGIHLAGEADASGRLVTRYAYLGYRPIAQIVAPQGLWQRVTAWLFGPKANTYSTSKAGRALALYDMSGRVVWQDAEAAGIRRVSLMKALHQPLRDVGQYADDESGLVYHMARFLDPESGRFLSPDPKGIADAVEHTRPDLLLNPYAYAGGYPDEFFDPDGAAKIRYYAITTGAKGQALGMTQGFTKARWAFVIYDIQGGGDSKTDLGKLRNQYAATNTGLLFDGKGDFIGSPADPLTGITNSIKTAIKWEGASQGNAIKKGFDQHYSGNIIGMPQFDIEFDDDNATKLIWYLMGKDEERVNCKSTAPGWLPEIKFAAEETPIKVTSATFGDASKQRILACGEGADGNLDQRRIAKYEAAAEINETREEKKEGDQKRINKDCSTDGCPGVIYYCNASKCFGQYSALATATSYVASYGRSQFVGSTLVGELIAAYSEFTAADKTAMNLTPAIKALLDSASARDKAMFDGVMKTGWWLTITAAASHSAAATAWEGLPPAQKAKFTAETGLGEQAYEDIVRFKTNPLKNSSGSSLMGDVREGFRTAAIMSDATLETYLMGIFKDFDKFTVMSHALMRKNMNLVLAKFPSANEEEIAGRVARLHNGGPGSNWKAKVFSTLISSDDNDYVKRFLGKPKYKSEGDWYSLRCVQSFGKNTVKPGTQGKGIGGLQMTPLILN